MILLTGGTGFLGSHLLRQLILNGEKVRAIRRSNSSMQLVANVADKVEWMDADILDVDSLADAMKGITHVYHCAAVVAFEKSEHQKMMKINVEGTANVVNACLEAKIEKLCYASSVAALGRSNEVEKLISEKSEWEDGAANTKYAVSKMLAEREVWRGVAEGLNAVIVNPTMILGSGDWNIGTAQFFKTVDKGLKFYTNGVNGYVGVQDVADVMFKLMNSSIANERFILTENSYGYKQIFDWIAESIGAKKPNIEASKLMSEIAWRAFAINKFFTGKRPVITRETAISANLKCYYDNSKIKSAIDFKFTPIKEVIEKTGAVYLQEKKNASL